MNNMESKDIWTELSTYYQKTKQNIISDTIQFFKYNSKLIIFRLKMKTTRISTYVQREMLDSLL